MLKDKNSDLSTIEEQFKKSSKEFVAYLLDSSPTKEKEVIESYHMSLWFGIENYIAVRDKILNNNEEV